MEKILYTPKEAGEALALGASTVVLLIRGGYLPAARFGRQYRIHRKDLEAFGETVRNGGVPQVWPERPWPEERQGYQRPVRQKLERKAS